MEKGEEEQFKKEIHEIKETTEKIRTQLRFMIFMTGLLCVI